MGDQRRFLRPSLVAMGWIPATHRAPEITRGEPFVDTFLVENVTTPAEDTTGRALAERVQAHRALRFTLRLVLRFMLRLMLRFVLVLVLRLVDFLRHSLTVRSG